ncbi:CinA family protein [Breznakiellaceae bacterium SP9]
MIEILCQAQLLVEQLKNQSKSVVAAESCTAGLAADLIACVPGASSVFWGSFVTYSIDAKVKMLGLDRNLLAKFGAVSRETALAMADAALKQSGSDYSFSITGIAGPNGDGTSVPVGTVWIGLAAKGSAALAYKFYFTGGRNEVRHQAAVRALEEINDYISSSCCAEE